MRSAVILLAVLCFSTYAEEPKPEPVKIVDKAEERVRLVRKNRELNRRLKELKKECDDLEALSKGTSDAAIVAKIADQLKLKVAEYKETLVEYKRNTEQVMKTAQEKK